MDKRYTPEIIEAAQTAQAATCVPASVSLAQFALESSFGAHEPAGSNNPFGIKARAGQPHVECSTLEFCGGRYVRLSQPFAKFASLAEAFEAHAHLLVTVSLYRPAIKAWKAGDLKAGVVAMAKHYATDPAYASKIMSIIGSNGLAELDRLPADPASKVS